MLSIVDRAMTIPGYMDRVDLEFLASLPLSHVTVEIGSYCGRSASVLSSRASRLFCVDDWHYVLGPFPTRHLPNARQMTIDKFYESMDNEIIYGRTSVLAVDSIRAARMFAKIGVHPDRVFIDADHSYPAVKADIVAWRGVLAPGGWLGGHDIHNFPGVAQAVKECVPNYRTVEGGVIWYAV